MFPVPASRFRARTTPARSTTRQQLPFAFVVTVTVTVHRTTPLERRSFKHHHIDRPRDVLGFEIRRQFRRGVNVVNTKR
jgi:hypothetical protein